MFCIGPVSGQRSRICLLGVAGNVGDVLVLTLPPDSARRGLLDRVRGVGTAMGNRSSKDPLAPYFEALGASALSADGRSCRVPVIASGDATDITLDRSFVADVLVPLT